MRRRQVLVVLLLGGAVAGCAAEPTEGYGIPRQPAPGVAGDRQPVRGVVRVADDGCLLLDLGDAGRRWVLWPEETTTTDGGATAVVGGRAARDGVVVSGSGVLVDAAALPGWGDPTTYLGSMGRFCDAEARGVVVLDEAEVGDVQALR